MSTDEYNQLHDRLQQETQAYVNHKELSDYYGAILRNSRAALELLTKAGKDQHRSGNALRKIIADLTQSYVNVLQYVADKERAMRDLNELIQNASVTE